MIDIENTVFNRIAKSLRSAFPGIFVTGEKVAIPKTYPCVAIEEADNYEYVKTQSSSSGENHASLMYEVQVFTNKTSGKKSECKSIFALTDNEFRNMGFVRTTKQPIPMDDAKTYQLVGRFQAVVSQNHTIYRR